MKELPLPLAILFSIITICIAIAWGFDELGWITAPDIFEPLIAGGTALSTATWGTVLAMKRPSDDSQPKSLRETLIDVVENNWIHGVLDDALRDTEFEIALKESPERLGDETPFKDYRLPFHLVESDATTPDNRTKTGDVLLKAFDHTGRKLLILGAPGSGKTVLLLQLAKKLLDEARKDEKHRIPVVFNLSSWAEKREKLADWLAGQLKQNYGVSDKLAQEWIAGDKLIYLLDGFDEVAENYREDCLTEINNFKTLTRQLVICSRIKEFEALAQPMSTKFAIEILPLEDGKFTNLLYTHLPNPEIVSTMVKILQADDDTWEEVKKPLFINVLLTTYADGRPFPKQYLPNTTHDKLNQLLLEPYVARQLGNNPNPQFSNANGLRWLSWIGHNLVKREQTVFYVEMLQFNWLQIQSTQKILK
ncbi:MAG: NACHT domain-containing protein [Chloroflexota bacterium]